MSMKIKRHKLWILNKIKSIIQRRKKQLGNISLGSKELNSVLGNNFRLGSSLGIFGSSGTYRTGLLRECFQGIINSNLPLRLNGKKPAIYVLSEDISEKNIFEWFIGKYINRKPTNTNLKEAISKMERLGFVVKFITPWMYSAILNDKETTYPYAVFVEDIQVIAFDQNAEIISKFIQTLREISCSVFFTKLFMRANSSFMQEIKNERLVQNCDVALKTARSADNYKTNSISITCEKSRGFMNYRKLKKIRLSLGINASFKHYKFV